MATKVKCPKCNKEIKLDISQSVSEDGEVYICPYCKYLFRFTEK